MTEAEWLMCTDPRTMYLFIRGSASDRKVRLFAVACCYRLWDLMTEERRDAIRIAERYADGLADDDERRFVFGETEIGDVDDTTWETSWAVRLALMERGDIAANLAHRRILRNRKRVDENAHVAFLRDIFGNHFRPVALDPSWPTSTVLAFASSIYEEKAFDRMPILADAFRMPVAIMKTC